MISALEGRLVVGQCEQPSAAKLTLQITQGADYHVAEYILSSDLQNLERHV